MGGGGGFGFSPQDKSILDQKAKDRIRQSQESVKRRLFISFAHEDLNSINAFRAQAKSQNSELEFLDHSVKTPFDSQDTAYIKRKISEKIEQCSNVLVFLTNDSSRSHWVRWEIDRAKELGKGVIAVKPSGMDTVELSRDTKAKIDKIVPWKHSDIMQGIEEVNSKRDERR